MSSSLNPAIDCDIETPFNIVVNGESDWNSNLLTDDTVWQHQSLYQSRESDILIYSLDGTPKHDVILEASGPSTFSLSFFLHGKGTLCVDGADPFELSHGKAVLFASDGFCHGRDILRKNARLFVVDIRYGKSILEKLGGISLARFAGSLIDGYSRPDQKVFLVPLPHSEELYPIILSILNCNLQKGQLRDIYLYSKAIEALSIALKIAENASKGSALKALNQREKQKLTQALHLIENNCGFDWSISRLAKQVGLNTRRLKEAFRLTIGRSVHAHLIETRIETAAELLLNGYSVTEAALAVGYENLSHFSKIFKSKKNILPSHYKAKTSKYVRL